MALTDDNEFKLKVTHRKQMGEMSNASGFVDFNDESVEVRRRKVEKYKGSMDKADLIAVLGEQPYLVNQHFVKAYGYFHCLGDKYPCKEDQLKDKEEGNIDF